MEPLPLSGSKFYANPSGNQKILQKIDAKQLLIESTFNLLWIPSEEEKKSISEKRLLLANNLPQEIAQHLFSLNRQIDLVRQFVGKITENFELWKNGCDSYPLQRRIRIQLHNLSCLVRSLIHHSNQLTGSFLEFRNDLNLETESFQTLRPFTKGDELFSQQSFQSLDEKIKKMVKAELPQQEISIKPARISSHAIAKQANLFELSREGEAWFKRQKRLYPKFSSTSMIYQLNRPVRSFFKKSNDEPTARAYMEALVWDMAVIFELESLFAATKVANLRNSKVGFSEVGAFQEAVKGTILREFLKEKVQAEALIDPENVIEATLALLLFGMFDAHQSNIIVNSQFKLQFFDNICSFPNSNQVIIWGRHLRCTTRSGLFSLNATFTPFSEAQKLRIKMFIDSLPQKMERLRTFLQSPTTKLKLKKLPKHWFATENVLAALEERVILLKQAISSPQVNNLRDLVFAVNPAFKIAAALVWMKELASLKQQAAPKTYFQTLFQEHVDSLPDNTAFDYTFIQKELLSVAGYEMIDTLIAQCIHFQSNPQQVIQWCRNPEIPFEQVLERIGEYVASIEIQEHLSFEVKNQIAQHLLLDFYERAAFDAKELKSEKAKTDFEGLLVGLSGLYEVPCFVVCEWDGETIHSFKRKRVTCGVVKVGSKESSFKIFYTNSKGNLRWDDLVMHAFSGKVLLKKRGIMTPQTMFKWLKSIIAAHEKRSK